MGFEKSQVFQGKLSKEHGKGAQRGLFLRWGTNVSDLTFGSDFQHTFPRKNVSFDHVDAIFLKGFKEF